MNKEWSADFKTLSAHSINNHPYGARIQEFKELIYIYSGNDILMAKTNPACKEKLEYNEILCVGCEECDSLDTLPYCARVECRCEIMDTDTIKRCKKNTKRDFFKTFYELSD